LGMLRIRKGGWRQRGDLYPTPSIQEIRPMKPFLACIALVIGLVGAVATPAAADPPSSAAFTVPVSCAGTTYLVGFIPGHGEFTPALVATNNQVLVPFSFDLTFTDVTTGESMHE